MTTTEHRPATRTTDMEDICETVAVSPLPPGSRNVYRGGDGKTFTTPCPAILLQEFRAALHETKTPDGNGGFNYGSYVVKHKPPFETRTVFADCRYNWIHPVDHDSDNYLATIGPGAEYTDEENAS